MVYEWLVMLTMFTSGQCGKHIANEAYIMYNYCNWIRQLEDDHSEHLSTVSWF